MQRNEEKSYLKYAAVVYNRSSKVGRWRNMQQNNNYAPFYEYMYIYVWPIEIFSSSVVFYTQKNNVNLRAGDINIML